MTDADKGGLICGLPHHPFFIRDLPNFFIRDLPNRGPRQFEPAWSPNAQGQARQPPAELGCLRTEISGRFPVGRIRSGASDLVEAVAGAPVILHKRFDTHGLSGQCPELGTPSLPRGPLPTI